MKKKLIGLDSFGFFFLFPPSSQCSIVCVCTNGLLLGLLVMGGLGLSAGHVFRFNKGKMRKWMERAYFLALLPCAVTPLWYIRTAIDIQKGLVFSSSSNPPRLLLLLAHFMPACVLSLLGHTKGDGCAALGVSKVMDVVVDANATVG